ncbi:MAG: hypothetical protein H6819_06030 [Phycisphaerales bacterium]|nr:hypothetical protein [Phycisphaerales bacterium]MCB9858620.1 hypothetical protein [Phycisphaerales bacterium]
MATQRNIIRTCEQCYGRKIDRSDIPRYQWFLLIAIVISLFGAAANSGWLLGGGLFVAFVASILIGRASNRDCPACNGRGKRRIVESIHETTNEEPPILDEIPHTDSDPH